MDATDLAFAGAAEQARLIAAGDVSSRELVQTYLDRIARLDPQLNAWRIVFAERALAEADQADARRGAGGERPLLGVPIAIKDDVDVGGEVTAWGTSAHGGPAPQDAEVVRRLRSAGAIVLGKTNVPGDDDLAVHRDDHVRRDAQSVGRRAHAGRLLRRDRRGGRVGHGRAGPRLRRARIDPHPGVLVRPVRGQAAARPRPGRAARRRLARAVGQRADRAQRRRRRAVPRRHGGHRRLRGRGSARAGQAADRDLDEARARAARADRAGRARGRRAHRGAAALARARRVRARPAPARLADAAPARALLPRHPRRRRGGDAAPRAARAPHTRDGAPRRGDPDERPRQAARRGGRHRRADQHDLRARRRAADARLRDAAVADRPVPRAAARCGRSTASRRASRSSAGGTAPASRPASCPRGSTATACRSACSSSGARTTRRRCCR